MGMYGVHAPGRSARVTKKKMPSEWMVRTMRPVREFVPAAGGDNVANPCACEEGVMGWECVARTRRVEARGNNKKENAIH